MKLPFKELLLLLYLASHHQEVAERIASLGLSGGLLLYAALCGLLAACLVLAAYIRSTPVRLVAAVVLTASAAYLHAYERITAEHLSYESFINLLNSAGFADAALEQHGDIIAQGVAQSLLLLAGLAWEPRYRLPLPRFAFVAAPLAGVAALALVLFLRGGEGARGLPGPFPPLAYALLYGYEHAADEAGPRQPVSIPHSAPKAKDLVLIVDESVAGNYLDLTTRGGVRSGLAEPRDGVSIHNYGYAAAITNCSVGTNVTLRHGGTRGGYRRINSTMPSIWQYARKAGLRTVYIDGQRNGGALHNMMTPEEMKDIDRFIQFDDVAIRDRDMAAADAVTRLVGDGTADLVIVNKVGAHFPIHDKYPDAFMRYRPALPRGGHSHISDTGSREGFGGTAKDWRRYRNAYRNTLLWSVGAFFDRLFAQADLSHTALIYTSDHGQDLHERGEPGRDTHCSSDPVMQEGVVPLVLVEGSALSLPELEANLPANRNRRSHYAVFPTLLTLMGYDPQAVQTSYGPSLLTRGGEDSTFNARFNARLGREPVWMSIDPAGIAEPPARDAGQTH